MNFIAPKEKTSSRQRIFKWVLIATWTLVVAASLGWNLVYQKQVTYELAHNTAVILYQKDLLYRRWVGNQGGVYVPVSTDTPPNPYLKDIPERDITTPSNRVLTLINPAYMTRQVYDLARQAGQPLGHITSLRPINPQNRPDPWEEKALQAFEQGRQEVSSIEQMKGQPYLRLMRPFLVEQNCLRCHASQGCKLGEIRGGISLAVPMTALWEASKSVRVALGVGHGSLWLLGLMGIFFGFHRIEKDQAQIITMMRTDPLTGLANRRFFLEMLDKAISFAARHQQSFSLVMADLDLFKAINDNFGHKAGDQALKAFAGLLEGSVRQEDLPSRFGGEEFILLLPATELKEAAVLAERIRQSLENLDIAGINRRTTGSFGVTQFQKGDTADAFIKRVDEALYRSKNQGRNVVSTG